MSTRSLLAALLLLSLPALAGCSLLGLDDGASDEAAWETINVGADSVGVLGVEPQRVAFAFEGGLPVPCYAFEEAVVERDGRTVHVKVRARSTADFCITVIGTLRVAPLEIAVPEAGTYTFAFWRGPDAAPLDVVVEVP